MNAGLAKALGVMMKLDFERAVLNRVPQMEAHPDRHFRQVMFICDEYQHFATVGESEPTGDEKFFSLSRQPKCIPIIATQSISSLKSALPGDTWRTLLQTPTAMLMFAGFGCTMLITAEAARWCWLSTAFCKTPMRFWNKVLTGELVREILLE
jgi:hypothetical protein